jgi:hypothetical protein
MLLVKHRKENEGRAKDYTAKSISNFIQKFIFSTVTLTRRSTVNLYRDKLSTWGNLAESILLALILGYMFYDLPGTSNFLMYIGDNAINNIEKIEIELFLNVRLITNSVT